MFKYHLTVAQVRGGMVFELANSVVLPFDCRDYAVVLRKYADKIYNISMKHPQEMKTYSVSFGMLPFLFQIRHLYGSINLQNITGYLRSFIIDCYFKRSSILFMSINVFFILWMLISYNIKI